MGKIPAGLPRSAIQDALASAGDPVYLKSPAPAAMAGVLTARDGMTDPAPLRVLIRPVVLRVALAGESAGFLRSIPGGDGLALRTSPTPVTDTTIVTRAGVSRFPVKTGEPVTSRADDFGESVYAAHTREWERAETPDCLAVATAGG